MSLFVIENKVPGHSWNWRHLNKDELTALYSKNNRNSAIVILRWQKNLEEKKVGMVVVVGAQ